MNTRLIAPGNTVAECNGLYSGIIENWNPVTGLGSIRGDNGMELVMHIMDLRKGREDLKAGERVIYNVSTDRYQRWWARDVRRGNKATIKNSLDRERFRLAVLGMVAGVTALMLPLIML